MEQTKRYAPAIASQLLLLTDQSPRNSLVRPASTLKFVGRDVNYRSRRPCRRAQEVQSRRHARQRRSHPAAARDRGRNVATGNRGRAAGRPRLADQTLSEERRDRRGWLQEY